MRDRRFIRRVASNCEIPRPEAPGLGMTELNKLGALQQNGAQIFQMRAA